MKKIKYLLILVAQIIALYLLLQSLTHGGMALLFGAGFGAVSNVVIQFGVIIMALFASALSFYLPTRSHRLLRDTQIQIAKYIGTLGMFQLLAVLLSNVSNVVAAGSSATIHPMFMSVMIMLYCMTAFMFPLNYVKNMFGIIKSVEKRDPRKTIRGYFE